MGGEVDDRCATLYTARVIHNTHATYTLADEIDSLARFKVEALPFDDDAILRLCQCAHMCEADDAGVQQRGGC